MNQQRVRGTAGAAEGESDTADWVTAAAVVALVAGFWVACWWAGGVGL